MSRRHRMWLYGIHKIETVVIAACGVGSSRNTILSEVSHHYSSVKIQFSSLLVMRFNILSDFTLKRDEISQNEWSVSKFNKVSKKVTFIFLITSHSERVINVCVCVCVWHHNRVKFLIKFSSLSPMCCLCAI